MKKIILILAALFILFRIMTCMESPQKPKCGEINEYTEQALTRHPCINMAWLEYDCVDGEWDGWIILDSTQTVEISHQSEEKVIIYLKDAADNFHYSAPPRIEIDIYEFKD